MSRRWRGDEIHDKSGTDRQILSKFRMVLCNARILSEPHQFPQWDWTERTDPGEKSFGIGHDSKGKEGGRGGTSVMLWGGGGAYLITIKPADEQL